VELKKQEVALQLKQIDLQMERAKGNAQSKLVGKKAEMQLLVHDQKNHAAVSAKQQKTTDRFKRIDTMRGGEDDRDGLNRDGRFSLNNRRQNDRSRERSSRGRSSRRRSPSESTRSTSYSSHDRR